MTVANASGVLGTRLPWWTRGDTEAFINVASQNLANLLSFVSILDTFYKSKGVSQDKIDDLVYAKIVPAFGISLAFGNVYYFAQAVIFSRQTGREDVSAQPFGVNTPGAFVFLASIIPPLFAAKASSFSPDEAATFSWQAAVAAVRTPPHKRTHTRTHVYALGRRGAPSTQKNLTSPARVLSPPILRVLRTELRPGRR